MPTPSALPFRSVIVETEHIGRLRAVSSVREAAELLVGGWPSSPRGNAYRRACGAAHAALAGILDGEAARKAFIRAAKEAGLFVREGR